MARASHNCRHNSSRRNCTARVSPACGGPLAAGVIEPHSHIGSETQQDAQQTVRSTAPGVVPRPQMGVAVWGRDKLGDCVAVPPIAHKHIGHSITAVPGVLHIHQRTRVAVLLGLHPTVTAAATPAGATEAAGWPMGAAASSGVGASGVGSGGSGGSDGEAVVTASAVWAVPHMRQRTSWDYWPFRTWAQRTGLTVL